MENYSEIIFNSGPVQTTDYINDRYDDTHSKLYKNAVDLLLIDLAKTDYHSLLLNGEITNDISVKDFVSEYVDNYKKTHKLIEIKNDEYFKPSSVLCVRTVFPFDRKKYDLSKYWNEIPGKRNNKDVSILYLDEDTIKYAELVYIDYVQGKCKFKSKLSGEEFWTTFDYINDETKVSELYSIKDTFTYKVQNKLFEE